jgi:histidine phosphotransferase ChpT
MTHALTVDLMTADLTTHSNLKRQDDSIDLATQLMAKLCHDFISPTGAIVSGLDLLDDPHAQDMRDEALNLIRASAKKLVTLVQFARLAYGAATNAESMNAKEIQALLQDAFSTLRAELIFCAPEDLILPRPMIRILVNLAYLTGQALPRGGQAHIEVTYDTQYLSLKGTAKGLRARLSSEALQGLKGEALSDGLHGQWIAPYWLYKLVNESQGELEVFCLDDQVNLSAHLILNR